MMMNEWVGRSWVQISVPAKFITHEISTFFLSLYNMACLLLSGVALYHPGLFK